MGGGTLSIGSLTNADGLANVSDVLIANGAVSNLGFGGVDVIDSLYIGGEPKAAGTWGSMSSAATNKTDRITGNAVLSVSTVGLLYGDYDANNIVDARDYVLWRNSVGTQSPWTNDRYTGTTIDDRQYTQWAEAFGAKMGPAPGGAHSRTGNRGAVDDRRDVWCRGAATFRPPSLVESKVYDRSLELPLAELWLARGVLFWRWRRTMFLGHQPAT